jgi:xanthine dehydrogenase YagS FAD-binding subunit
VTVPPPPLGRQSYRKVRDRASYAFALVSIAGIVAVENGRISHAALAFGGIGTMPWRDHDAESLLIGAAPDAALFARVADAVLAEARGSGANDFKLPLFRRTLTAFLEALTQENAR